MQKTIMICSVAFPILSVYVCGICQQTMCRLHAVFLQIIKILRLRWLVTRDFFPISRFSHSYSYWSQFVCASVSYFQYGSVCAMVFCIYWFQIRVCARRLSLSLLYSVTRLLKCDWIIIKIMAENANNFRTTLYGTVAFESHWNIFASLWESRTRRQTKFILGFSPCPCLGVLSFVVSDI